MNQKNFKKIFIFLHKIENLKTTIRFASVKNALNDSVADHSWRLAVMVFLVAEELKLKLDKYRTIKLALIHDLGGDVDYRQVATGKISEAEKQKFFQSNINKLKVNLPSKLAKEIGNLWNEFNECKTKEAKFVKAMEKLETLSHIYEAGHKTYTNPELIPNYADQAIKDFPELTDLLKIIKQQFKLEFKQAKIPWKETYD